MTGMDVKSTAMLLPFAFFCVAAFTKSAQVPFESWLCGAMVAPTPVSALLHSATMVKAGTYLLLRMAPAFADTTMSTIVALFGAFTFVATCILAVSQSNAKKILAYSTIANLGLTSPAWALIRRLHDGGHHHHHLPLRFQGPALHVRGHHRTAHRLSRY